MMRLSDDQTERLLASFADLWGGRAFDEATIAYTAPEQPRLRLALLPLQIRYRRDGQMRKNEKHRVADWLTDNAGRQAGELRLVRDRYGWCWVRRAP